MKLKRGCCKKRYHKYGIVLQNSVLHLIPYLILLARLGANATNELVERDERALS